MCDFFATPPKKCTDSGVKDEGKVHWVQVEFGGRIYLVPRS